MKTLILTAAALLATAAPVSASTPTVTEREFNRVTLHEDRLREVRETFGDWEERPARYESNGYEFKSFDLEAWDGWVNITFVKEDRRWVLIFKKWYPSDYACAQHACE